MVIRLMWHVAWDTIDTIDNQYIGLRKKVSQIINWLDLIPTKFCRTRLGLPRRYMVLSDFMLCPVFIGNCGLERETSRFKDAFQWTSKETKIERLFNLLENVWTYYLDRWKLKIFDRGKWTGSELCQSIISVLRGMTDIKLRGLKNCHRWKLVMEIMVLLKIVLCKSRYALNTAAETIRRVNFDSDGIPFVVDNSANCHICTEKSYFTNLHMFTDFEKRAIGSIGTVGDGAVP